MTTEDVSAGTILIREVPFFAVNPDAAAAEGETLHSQIAKEIVCAGAGRMPQLAALHPITLAPPHLTAEQKSYAAEKHGDAVNSLLATDQAKAAGYTFDEVLRIVLARKHPSPSNPSAQQPLAGPSRPRSVLHARSLAKISPLCHGRSQQEGHSKQATQLGWAGTVPGWSLLLIPARLRSACCCACTPNALC